MNPERIEQWKKAQTKERQFHTDPFEIGYIKFAENRLLKELGLFV
jgi:hypothetical protein